MSYVLPESGNEPLNQFLQPTHIIEIHRSESWSDTVSPIGPESEENIAAAKFLISTSGPCKNIILGP